VPITTTFDKKNPDTTAEAILGEWLADFYASSSYIVTFEGPRLGTKPVVWLHKMPSENREVRTRKGGQTIQGKRMVYAVSMIAHDRAENLRMTDRLQGAVLASASNFISAGLRYIEVTPFQEIVVDSQEQVFRRDGIFHFVVEV
jgi:hypothetical protein